MAYINVDISVFGMGETGLTGGGGGNKGAGVRIEPFSGPPTANATLRAQGTPPVQSVIFSAAKQVKGAGRAGGGGATWVGGAGTGTIVGAGAGLSLEAGLVGPAGRCVGWRLGWAGPRTRSLLGRGGANPETRVPSGQVPAPGPGSLSVYDNWIRYFNRSSPVYGLVPR